MYQSEEILKQRFIEQIGIDEFNSLSMMERMTILDKFFDDNRELVADIVAKNAKKIVKDFVNVKDLAVGDRNIFYVGGSEYVNQEDGQEE